LTIVMTRPGLRLAAALAFAFLFAAVAAPSTARAQEKSKADAKEDGKDKDKAKEKKMTKTDSGLQYRDTKEGDGPKPEKGQTCVMHYTGWLWEDGKKGKKFDSSHDRDEPFEFPIGMKRVIGGWDEGVLSMKKGGKRELLIPPDLGYGKRGFPGAIPPNSTLFFEVELLDIKD
jgi:peptidylprolyl isomerase